MSHEQLISVQDVYNVIREHLNALDTLWPEDQRYGPRKVHIVELIDAIKLRLVQRAEKNSNKFRSPFEVAARKVTGADQLGKNVVENVIGDGTEKSAMQIAMEEAKARIAKSKAAASTS